MFGVSRTLATLHRHLTPGAKAGVLRAAGLGRQAAALGLETLDLARIHERSLMALLLPGSPSRTRKRMINRARGFFAEAVALIERTHRAARETDAHVSQLEQTLRTRTVESCASARQLKRGILQRRAAEAALKQSTQHRAKLLAASRRLQKQLRHLTHKILAAQENDRQRLSRQLQDDIAQLLLAINVRLLALKQAAGTNTTSLKNEIASTQRLVRQSAQTISGFAHEFGLHRES